MKPVSQLRADALAIWQASVEAVRSDRLVKDNVRIDGDWLLVGDETIELSKIGRIAVVGAGKAGAGMAAGLEETLGPRVLSDKQVRGWVNVPADCVEFCVGVWVWENMDGTNMHKDSMSPVKTDLRTID